MAVLLATLVSLLGGCTPWREYIHNGFIKVGPADLQRGKKAGDLRPEIELELLNDAIFGDNAIALAMKRDQV
jgi:hypothetical protein